MRLFGPTSQDQVLHVPREQVQPNPYQPRRTFPEESLRELSLSIREVGILEPLVVRKLGNVYELVAGERRLRAAELLDMKTVPVIVKDFTDQEVAQATLVENIQREDLNVIDEAFAYDRLLDEFNLTQEELAGRLGKSQSTVANRRRLLKLPQSVQESLRTGDLNERHGRALLRLPDEARILEVADLIIKKNLTVRETDKLVEELLLSGAEESAAAVAKNLRRFVPRDYRIFLNSVLDAVKTLRAAGLPAEVDQTETEEYVQVKVLIPKARPGSKK